MPEISRLGLGNRSGMTGKHFVMLGNDFLTQQCAAMIGKRRQCLKFRGVPSENWTIILDSVRKWA
jgi:hypothetical protein